MRLSEKSSPAPKRYSTRLRERTRRRLFAVSWPPAPALKTPSSLFQTVSRNCLKSPEGVSNVASQGTEAPLFGPFRPRYTGQIHPRSVAQTPFQTVSRRSSENCPFTHSDGYLLRKCSRLVASSSGGLLKEHCGEQRDDRPQGQSQPGDGPCDLPFLLIGGGRCAEKRVHHRRLSSLIAYSPSRIGSRDPGRKHSTAGGSGL